MMRNLLEAANHRVQRAAALREVPTTNARKRMSKKSLQHPSVNDGWIGQALSADIQGGS